jgi:hypothetical protein
MLMIRYASRISNASRDDRVSVRATGPAVAVCAMLLALSAFAPEARAEPQLDVVSPAPAAQPPATQPPATQPPATQPPATQPPNPNYQPGFIDVFGRFIGDSAAKLSSQLKSTNETLGDLRNQTSDAAKGAAGTIIGLPNARIVTGRERCAAAANGAPDCRAAADAACRSRGFASGKSLDTQSTQKCPARVWLSGRFPSEGDCQLETFVIRAVCQ